MSYTATLSRTTSPELDNSGNPAMQVTYTVTAVSDFADKGLFLFKAGEFQSVCTPVDLLDYSMGTPGADTDFVRADTVTLVSATSAELSETVAYLEADIRELAQTMDTLKTLGQSVVVTIP